MNKCNAEELSAHHETLKLAEEQMTWLRSLFSAIQNDLQGHDVKNLASVGQFLSEMWADGYSVMMQNEKSSNLT